MGEMTISKRTRARILAGTLFLVVLALLSSITNYLIPQLPSYTLPSLRSPISRNAFCVFLAEPNEIIKDGEEDYYFMGTRMLIYQLLHDPETRTRTGVHFVVAVTTDVTEEKRTRLRQDGATVIEIGAIDIDWIKPARPRWKHVMDKLHVFELVQYEKILLLDSDIVATKNLDGVFDDSAGNLLPNKADPEQTKDDEAPQPVHYTIAGNCGPSDNHGYPAGRCGWINAGFVLFRPSVELYKHYMSIAAIEGRFTGTWPEQDLWNYAHRKDGNMPWQQLNPDWNVNHPNFGDYEHGVASFHEKYWRCGRDKKLRDVLLKSRWKMEGFFNSYHPSV